MSPPAFLTSMRVRLTLWNVLVFALTLTILGVLLRGTVQANLLAGVDRELAERARRFQDRPGPPPPHPGQAGEGGRDNLPDRARFPRPPEGRRIDRENPLRPRFFSPDGMDLFNSDPAPPLDPTAVAQSVHENRPLYSVVFAAAKHEKLRVLTVALRHGGPQGKSEIGGIFQTAQTLAPVETEINRLTRTLFTLLPAALLIAGAGAAFLTDRSLRPVRAVTRAASQIEAQDLSGRLVVTGQDEFSRLAATFNGMLARLESAFQKQEEAFEQQRRFVADASHELRTPLTVIKANTSLTLSEPDLAPDYRDVLTEVDHAADRTIRIVEDLLLLARSDGDQLPMRHETVLISDLFTQLKRESGWAVRRRDNLAPLLIPANEDVSLAVRGDAHYLVRLLVNLTDNALRHTPPHGTVTVSASRNGTGNVVVTVADTGEGIALEHLPHLVKRFYRVDSSRARADGGTGLGLAICQAIVDAHGGTLQIESELGKGTTVRALLPIASPPAAR